MAPKSYCNLFTTNFILSSIDYTICTIFFTMCVGKFILPNYENFWQFYENNNLPFLAFFIIFGAWRLEVHGTSGTNKSNLIAMFFVFLFLIIRSFVLLRYITIDDHENHIPCPKLLFVLAMWNCLRFLIQFLIIDQIKTEMDLKKAGYEEIMISGYEEIMRSEYEEI